MKAIVLMRHAKAQPIAPGQRDFDRPLAARGKEDAARMGRVLLAMKLVPDALVASPARRAKETAELAAKAMKLAGQIRWDRRLYEASGSAWIEALRSLPKSVEVAMLVAHNPGIEEAASLLAGAPRGFLDCPTGGLIGFESGIGAWSDLREGGAVLRFLSRPKMYGDSNRIR
jgi:phosphohistidine phosphatase